MKLIFRLCLLIPSIAGASPGGLSIAWDNDLLTGTDKGYTNGLRLTYLGATTENDGDCKACLAHTAKERLDWLPVIGRTSNAHTVTFSLSQFMVTPENIQATGPIFEDLPYTGYLSASGTLWSWNARSLTGFGLAIGVVGPDSGAKAIQTWVHKFTGSTRPKGWDNQLGTDVIGEVHTFHARKFFRKNMANNLSQEMAWMAGGTLSNFISSAELGVSWRIGTNLPANFIPDYAGASSTIGLPGSLNSPGPGWASFVGMGIEVIPYSYLEEQSGRYDYDQRLLIGVAGIGIGWHAPGFNLAITLRATTSQDETNKNAFSFGTVSATWGF